MKRKTKVQTVSVFLYEDYQPLSAISALQVLNSTFNEKVLTVAINPDQIKLQFVTDEYNGDCKAYFDFERWETDEEFELRKSDAKAKRNVKRLQTQQKKEAERAEYERLKKIYG